VTEHKTIEQISHAEHDHPSDRSYVGVALILGVITAAEVAVSYIDVGKLFVPSLIIMMTAKFSIVGAYFMHLKFDSNLFTRVFVSGILLAIAVYLAAIVTFTRFDVFGS
jgi:cytochrome c oxidase subunit IV